MPKPCRYDATWGTGALTVIDNPNPLRTRYQIVGTGWMDIPVGGSISISGAIKLPHSGGALNVRLNGKASTFEATLSPETNCNGSVGIAQNEEFNSILFLDFDTITT